MKKHFCRFVAFLLAFVMVLGIAPILPASATTLDITQVDTDGDGIVDGYLPTPEEYIDQELPEAIVTTNSETGEEEYGYGIPVGRVSTEEDWINHQDEWALLSFLENSGISYFALGDYSDDMLYNDVLDSLEYLGYSVSELRNKTPIPWLYSDAYISYNCPAAYRTNIGYGSASTGLEYKTDSSTVSGYAPNVSKFESGGLVCASFVAYYLLNYLRYIEGVDYQVFRDNLLANSRTTTPSEYVPSWVDELDAMADKGWYTQDDGSKMRITTPYDFHTSNKWPSGGCVAADMSALQAGDILTFHTGNSSTEYIHMAIYLGTAEGIYNGASTGTKHYVAHVGNERGPEISTIEELYEYGGKGAEHMYLHAAYRFEIDTPTTEQKGYIKVTKTSSKDGSKLGGATFKAVNNSTGETFYIGPTSSSTGTAISDPLPLGTYTVTETTAPDGYKLNSTSQTVTVTANNVSTTTAASVAFKNDPKVGYIRVYKKDATDKTTALTGATFEIYNSSGVLVDTLTTSGTSGTDISVALPVGTYTVKETAAPDGYNLSNPSQWTVEVKESHTTSSPYSLTVYNKLKTGYLEVFKKDALTGAALTGAVFEVYDSSGTKVATLTTSGTNGSAKSGELPIGTYTVKEVTPPTDYELSDPSEWTVQITENHTSSSPYQLTANNMPSPGTGKIRKTVNAGEAGGWNFKIYTDAACTKEYDGVVYTTNTNGYVDVELPIGTYYFKEVTSGVDDTYWTFDTNVYSAVIKSNQVTDVGPFNNIYNGRIKIIKEMATDGDPSGWVFEVTDSSGNPVEGSPFTSGADGTITTGKLLPGTYTVKEVIAEDSPYYCKSNNPQTITVSAGKTASVTFTNALKPGKVEILKVDENGKALTGVKFQLEWSEDGKTWNTVTYSSSADVVKGGCSSASLQSGCLITNSSGVATFENLYPLVQYRIKEVETVTGQTLLSEPIVISALDVDLDYEYSVKVHNDGTFELPRTGSTDVNTVVIAGSAAIAFAVAVLAYLIVTKKRKESNNS